MRKFIVNVNGTSYEVEVEEMDSAAVNAAASKPAANAGKAEVLPEQRPLTGNGETISAPMLGVIKKVLVKNGDSVKKGDVLFILEAMKLENEIMAPVTGKITSVCTTEASTVNPGDVLCTIA